MRSVSYRWVIVAAGALVMAVTHGVTANCFSLYIQPVTSALGMTRQHFSINQTIVNIIYMVVSILCGRIYKRVNAVRLMRVCAVILPVSYFCYSFCMLPLHFWMVSVMVGLSVAFLTFLPLTLIISEWFPDQQGTAIGLCFMGSGLGGMILNALGGRLITDCGWQATYRTIAAMMICVLVPVIWLLIREAPPTEAPQPESNTPADGEDTGATVQEAFGRLSFWALLVLAMIIGLTTTVASNVIIPHLTDIGFSPRYASGIMSVQLGALAACKVILGRMNDKLGVRTAAAVALLGTAAGLICLYFGRTTPLHGIIILGVAVGCASCTVSYPPLTRWAFGTHSYMTLYGIVNAANALTTSFAQVFSNTVYDCTGRYDQALLICAALAVAALFPVFFIRSWKEKHTENI